MLFNSYAFIFGLLPAVLVLFLLACRYAGWNVALAVIVAGSLFFYGWWNPAYLFLILGSVATSVTIVGGVCGSVSGNVVVPVSPPARRSVRRTSPVESTVATPVPTVAMGWNQKSSRSVPAHSSKRGRKSATSGNKRRV